MEIEVTARSAELLINKLSLVIKAIDMFEKIEVRVQFVSYSPMLLLQLGLFDLSLVKAVLLAAAVESHSIFDSPEPQATLSKTTSWDAPKMYTSISAGA
jgi:hypothetical protein